MGKLTLAKFAIYCILLVVFIASVLPVFLHTIYGSNALQ
jgi:hypothetical protein